ncbi:MAG: RcpC/CpaB family pilus assembly protein [Oscillospiraceae bacterium]|nr:RcpC/CpaB family pilus assembly protein [Oscillospiraceae bacterium]
MQKILKNKLFISTACLVLAAVLSFVLLPKIYEDETATANVLVLNQTVVEGTEITEKLLTTAEVGAFGLSGAVATDKEQVIGMVATSTIYEGEYLTKNRLVSAEEYENSGHGTALAFGEFLLTLKLPSTSAGLAGLLRGGALVDVYTTTENENGAIETEKALSEISVKQVLNSKLESLDDLDESLAEESDSVKDEPDYAPVYIVVTVDEAQAKTLIALEKAENFHLVLTRAGD